MNIGICKLCEQLNLDPIEDVRVLVLLYKLGANKKPAEIQKEEWMAGCHALSLDGIDKFKKFVPQLDTGFMDREEFGDFYKVRKKNHTQRPLFFYIFVHLACVCVSLT